MEHFIFRLFKWALIISPCNTPEKKDIKEKVTIGVQKFNKNILFTSYYSVDLLNPHVYPSRWH
jgi:hypothetical protein